jgi:hypothetical protein
MITIEQGSRNIIFVFRDLSSGGVNPISEERYLSRSIYRYISGVTRRGSAPSRSFFLVTLLRQIRALAGITGKAHRVQHFWAHTRTRARAVLIILTEFVILRQSL